MSHWCWRGGSVSTAVLPSTAPNSAFLLPLLPVDRQHLSPASTGPITSSQSPNHDRPAELRRCGTVSLKQSFCCSTETGDVTAYFQATTEGLPVPHLMFWRTERTFTARRCCDVFVILAPDIKLQTYLLIDVSVSRRTVILTLVQSTGVVVGAVVSWRHDIAAGFVDHWHCGVFVT